jgi:NinB protein
MRITRELTARNRDEVLHDVRMAPLGWRITIEAPRRTSQQNRMMWALLQAFADQVVHDDRHYSPEDWKCIFMKALGKELQFATSLDGQEIVALGYRSSELSKAEMSDLCELILSEGLKIGVSFTGEPDVPRIGKPVALLPATPK